MEYAAQRLPLLLLITALVAIATRRYKLPYSVGLVLAGIGIGLSPLAFSLPVLTRELIFSVLLPPLIFEAAFSLQWPALKKNFPVIGVLATVGLLLAAGLTAVGMHFGAGWPWATALLLGILISATDPVAVIATFKEVGLTGRLRLLIEAESLFNDATAAVAFTVAVALASGHAMAPLQVVSSLVFSVAGGVGVGALVAYALLWLAGKTEDHLVEVTLTTVAAYGAFLAAEHWHCSGVLATLTAGIILGNSRRFGEQLGTLTDKGRESVEVFWEMITFGVNAVIFLLMGSRMVHQNMFSVALPAMLAIILVLAGRALAIYPLCLLFGRSSLRVSSRHQHVLFWGGLRGALALALVLGLPQDLPYRDELVTVTFAVVVFSVFVQGLTITPLLRRLGQLEPDTPSPAHPLTLG